MIVDLNIYIKIRIRQQLRINIRAFLAGEKMSTGLVSGRRRETTLEVDEAALVVLVDLGAVAQELLEGDGS